MNQDENDFYGDEPFKSDSSDSKFSKNNKKCIDYAILGLIVSILNSLLPYDRIDKINLPEIVKMGIVIVLLFFLLVLPIYSIIYLIKGKREKGYEITLIIFLICTVLEMVAMML